MFYQEVSEMDAPVSLKLNVDTMYIPFILCPSGMQCYLINIDMLYVVKSLYEGNKNDITRVNGI